MLKMMDAEKAVEAYCGRLYNAAMPTAFKARIGLMKSAFPLRKLRDISRLYRYFANADGILLTGSHKYTSAGTTGNNSSAATKHICSIRFSLANTLRLPGAHAVHKPCSFRACGTCCLQASGHLCISMVEKINRFGLTDCIRP
jgi:hypothetical protein